MKNVVYPVVGLTFGLLTGWMGASAVTSGGMPSISMPSFGSSNWLKSNEGILAKIDAVAAYPDDPSLPPGIKGVSDEELADLDWELGQAVLEHGAIAIQSEGAEPRHLFELARIAFVLGEDVLGMDYLTSAAGAGSAIAHAYLGDFASENGDRALAMQHYQAAVEGGYEAAREPLDFYVAQVAEEEAAERAEQERLQAEARAQQVAEAQAEQQRKAAAQSMLNNFLRPHYIAALKNRDYSVIDRDGSEAVAYLSQVNQVLEEPSIWYRARGLDLEIDPKLSLYLGQKTMTDPEMLDEMVSSGLGRMLGGLVAMGQARQSGSSITEEMAAFNRAIIDPNAGPLYGDEIADGQKDGQRLAELYNYDPELFREIYSGMVDYVYNH
jgi:hypothetical protein